MHIIIIVFTNSNIDDKGIVQMLIMKIITLMVYEIYFIFPVKFKLGMLIAFPLFI